MVEPTFQSLKIPGSNMGTAFKSETTRGHEWRSFKTWSALTFGYIKRSALSLELTYGELKPFNSFNDQLILSVCSAPGTNLW